MTLPTEQSSTLEKEKTSKTLLPLYRKIELFPQTPHQQHYNYYPTKLGTYEAHCIEHVNRSFTFFLNEWSLKRKQKDFHQTKDPLSSSCEKEEKPSDFVNETKREFVTPVRNVNNGYSSPATILTDWMNNTEECTKRDLIDNSGGLLDLETVNLLLKDDANAWSDKKTLDIISRLTYSNPREWKQARRNWEDGEE